MPSYFTNLNNSNVSTVEPELSSVLAVPTETEQRVVAGEVRQLDLVSQDGTIGAVCFATLSSRAGRRHATAVVLGPTSEPRLSGRASPVSTNAIGVNRALLSRYVIASKLPCLEASLEGGHLAVVGCVVGFDERSNDAVISADPVAIEAAVVSDVRHAPLDINNLCRLVSGRNLRQATS